MGKTIRDECMESMPNASLRSTDNLSEGLVSQPSTANAADPIMVIHAVFPPPVTGMSVCTESVADAVSQRISVRRYNWSNGEARITSWFRLMKSLRALTTPFRLLFGRRPPHAVFYMPCNAGLATFYNFLALSIARRRGYRCVLHHHYFRYVDRYERRIQILSNLLGPNDLQIVLCPAMERGFREKYGKQLPLAVVPSTIQLLSAAPSSAINATGVDFSGPFCLGHLSNLQLAKGLDLVLEVLRTLRKRGIDVRLILAGPIDTGVERRMIQEAQLEFGDRLDYRGPVYGSDKQQFFRDIQAMVYPTRNDAQPLVVMEAFSYGRPVISFGRGCISGMLPRHQWSVAVDNDFVSQAVEVIERWIDDPAALNADQQLARSTFDSAVIDAHKSLENLVRWICREPVQGFVRRDASNETATT